MATILIAEDEKDIRDLIKFTLQVGGHTILTVNNGEDAVQKAQEALPDLILLDMRMPRMDGTEACDILQSEPATQHIPIMFLSGNEAEDSQLERVAGFINKPFDPMELQAKVADFLNQIGTA